VSAGSIAKKYLPIRFSLPEKGPPNVKWNGYKITLIDTRGNFAVLKVELTDM